MTQKSNRNRLRRILGILLLLFLLSLIIISCSRKSEVYMPLIPMPQQIEWGEKWMYACVPVEVNGMNVGEVEGLKFSIK